ncbi:MAG: hypothetical protein VB036_14580, partial [Propionicimonas sp.]|nr:hypothetical protein [Propionicimonas sp.]
MEGRVAQQAPAIERLRAAARTIALGEAAQARAIADLAAEHDWADGDEFDVIGLRPVRLGADGTALIDETLPAEVAAVLGKVGWRRVMQVFRAAMINVAPAKLLALAEQHRGRFCAPGLSASPPIPRRHSPCWRPPQARCHRLGPPTHQRGTLPVVTAPGFLPAGLVRWRRCARWSRVSVLGSRGAATVRSP